MFLTFVVLVILRGAEILIELLVGDVRADILKASSYA